MRVECSLLVVGVYACAFSKKWDHSCRQILKGACDPREASDWLPQAYTQPVSLGAVGMFQSFQGPLNRMLVTANIEQMKCDPRPRRPGASHQRRACKLTPPFSDPWDRNWVISENAGMPALGFLSCLPSHAVLQTQATLVPVVTEALWAPRSWIENLLAPASFLPIFWNFLESH